MGASFALAGFGGSVCGLRLWQTVADGEVSKNNWLTAATTRGLLVLIGDRQAAPGRREYAEPCTAYLSRDCSRLRTLTIAWATLLDLLAGFATFCRATGAEEWWRTPMRIDARREEG